MTKKHIYLLNAHRQHNPKQKEVAMAREVELGHAQAEPTSRMGMK